MGSNMKELFIFEGIGHLGLGEGILGQKSCGELLVGIRGTSKESHSGQFLIKGIHGEGFRMKILDSTKGIIDSTREVLDRLIRSHLDGEEGGIGKEASTSRFGLMMGAKSIPHLLRVPFVGDNNSMLLGLTSKENGTSCSFKLVKVVVKLFSITRGAVGWLHSSPGTNSVKVGLH
jgi:hypothetical protein